MFDVEQPVVVANGQIHRHACCGVKLLHERKSALAHREALVDEVAEFQQPESKTPLSGGILLYVCATRHKVHTTYRYLFDRTKEFHRCPRLGVKRRSE